MPPSLAAVPFFDTVTSLVREGRNFTLRQIAIIGICQQSKDPLTCADVARELEIAQVVVGRAVDLLEHEGLVKRERLEEDRRKIYLHLTATGKSFPA